MNSKIPSNAAIFTNNLFAASLYSPFYMLLDSRGESRISCHWGQGLTNGVKDVLIFYLKSNLLVDERIFKEFLASYRGQLTPMVTHRFAPGCENRDVNLL